MFAGDDGKTGIIASNYPQSGGGENHKAGRRQHNDEDEEEAVGRSDAHVSKFGRLKQ